MRIVVDIIMMAALLVASYFYLKKTNEEEKYEGGKKLIIFHVVMAAVLTGLIIAIEMIYGDNAFSHNTKLIFLVACLVPIAWKDYFEYKIPNKIILFLLGFRFIFVFWEFMELKTAFFEEIKQSMMACFGIGVFLIIVHLVFKNSIGMGDIKLMMIMALYQGFYGVFGSIFFSMIGVCVLGIVLMIAKKKGRKDALPFAPAILIGTLLSVAMSGM